MNTKIKLGFFAIFISILFSANAQRNSHNSRNSLDWAGTYEGTFFSATRGEEMITMITLRPDMTYSIETRRIAEDYNTVKFDGNFTWNRQGSQITLREPAENQDVTLQVEENQLRRIAVNGKRVRRNVQKNAVYTKIEMNNNTDNNTITEKYWKLIEINGKPVKMDENSQKEPHMILRNQDHRFNGSGGCNTFNGSYEMKEGNRITFSRVASTMMACINMETETEMFRMFEMVDNYTVSEDGKYLSLNRARMAPLARFEVVYLR